MALAKQFDFQVTGRGTLTDPSLPVSASNLVFTADIVTVNGVSFDLTSLDGTAMTSLTTALETIVSKLNNTVQTVALGSASVADGQTVTITADNITVTYTNSSGSAVAGTAGALATALKTACDANATFAARFSTAISSNDLVITQKAPQVKIAKAVIAGTGISGADNITVS